jgi:hypothetical protein
MDIYAKIDSGCYEPKSRFIPYSKAGTLEAYENQPYLKEEEKLLQNFKKDAILEAGLDPDNSMTGRAWDMAWELGHSNGYSGVYGYLRDIAYVINGDT